MVILEKSRATQQIGESFELSNGEFPRAEFISFKHYTGQGKADPLTLSPDHDLARFSEAVQRWSEKLDSDDSAALQVVALEGQLHLVKIEPEVLGSWYQSEQLHFREPRIDQSRLSKITTPLRPDSIGDGPVITVLLANGERAIVQGNHRTWQAISAGDTPIYALEFSSPESFSFTFGYTLKPISDPLNGAKSWGPVRLQLA